MARQVNAAGIALIKSFETLQLTVYLDPAGIPTVGYGHVTMLPVGSTITASIAELMFQSDLAEAARCVELATFGVMLTDDQFAALVSLTFNIGCGAFRGSTLLRDLLAGDFADVPAQDARWDHSGGRVLTGLDSRRAAEIALWNANDNPSPPTQLVA